MLEVLFGETNSCVGSDNFLSSNVEFTWGVHEEYVDFNQFKSKEIPKVFKILNGNKKNFLVCWMMKDVSWKHHFIVGTFFWYRDGYSELEP